MCGIVALAALACDGSGEDDVADGLVDDGLDDDGLDDVPDATDDASDGVSDEPAIPDPLHYVALGDSIAAGSAARTSYVEEYADWLHAETGASVRVENTAVPGWTIEDLLPAVRDDEDLRRDLAAAHLITSTSAATTSSRRCACSRRGAAAVTTARRAYAMPCAR